MDLLGYLCLVFVILLCLFIAALWSSVGKGLSTWLSFVMLNCVLSRSHVVSWFRCGTQLYRFLIFAPSNIGQQTFLGCCIMHLSLDLLTMLY